MSIYTLKELQWVKVKQGNEKLHVSVPLKKKDMIGHVMLFASDLMHMLHIYQ